MKKSIIFIVLTTVLMTACNENEPNKNKVNQVKRENTVNSLINLTNEHSQQRSLRKRQVQMIDYPYISTPKHLI